MPNEPLGPTEGSRVPRNPSKLTSSHSHVTTATPAAKQVSLPPFPREGAEAQRSEGTGPGSDRGPLWHPVVMPVGTGEAQPMGRSTSACFQVPVQGRRACASPSSPPPGPRQPGGLWRGGRLGASSSARGTGDPTHRTLLVSPLPFPQVTGGGGRINGGRRGGSGEEKGEGAEEGRRDKEEGEEGEGEMEEEGVSETVFCCCPIPTPSQSL